MKQKPQSRIRFIAAFALGAVLVSSMAFAQQAGPRGQGGPGGPGQGGPGQFGQGQRPGMMRGGPMILQRPDVQKELKLSEEQIEKIRQLAPPMGRRGEGRDMPPDQGQGQGRRGEGQPGGQPNPGEMEGKIKAILNESQYARYKEMEIQFVGASIVLREDIARNLQLSNEQVEKIRALLPGPGGPGGPGGQRGPGGQGERGGNGGVAGAGAGQRPPQGGPGGQRGPGQMPPMNDEFRKQQDERILAILTSQQREKFEAMKGKAFKFEQGRPPVPPGE